MIEEVFDMALLLGNGGENRQILSALCQVAVTELEGRLRSGLRAEDCQPAFTIGAAWLALAYLEEQVSSFSAGDFSVTTKAGGFRKSGEDLMRPYVQLSDFAFCSVKG